MFWFLTPLNFTLVTLAEREAEQTRWRQCFTLARLPTVSSSLLAVLQKHKLPNGGQSETIHMLKKVIPAIMGTNENSAFVNNYPRQ